jgi:hypothetical protein
MRLGLNGFDDSRQLVGQDAHDLLAGQAALAHRVEQRLGEGHVGLERGAGHWRGVARAQVVLGHHLDHKPGVAL